MEHTVFLTLCSYCERYTYEYIVTTLGLSVLITDREKDSRLLKSVHSSEDWQDFLDIFELFYTYEEVSDSKLDEFISGLPLLAKVGIPSKVLDYDQNGNATVLLKTSNPIAICFKQEEIDDEFYRDFYWQTRADAFNELNRHQDFKKLDRLEKLLLESWSF